MGSPRGRGAVSLPHTTHHTPNPFQDFPSKGTRVQPPEGTVSPREASVGSSPVTLGGREPRKQDPKEHLPQRLTGPPTFWGGRGRCWSHMERRGRLRAPARTLGEPQPGRRARPPQRASHEGDRVALSAGRGDETRPTRQDGPGMTAVVSPPPPPHDHDLASVANSPGGHPASPSATSPNKTTRPPVWSGNVSGAKRGPGQARARLLGGWRLALRPRVTGSIPAQGPTRPWPKA